MHQGRELIRKRCIHGSMGAFRRNSNTPLKVKIDSRYCGPPDSGNGGYTCGIVAKLVDGPAEVTLHRPPPLNQTLKIDSEKVILYDETGMIAEAVPTNIEFNLPQPPAFSENA